jgi:hypothetical protein
MERMSRAAWKTCCFVIIIANLPFLTAVHLMGINMFLTSFQHPDVYQYLKIQNAANRALPKGYLLLETPTSQEFLIHNGDTILYRTGEGVVKCESVLSVELHHGTTVYYTMTSAQDDIKGPVYDAQILGKVTRIIDDNLWNAICLRLWEFSIQHLNVYHLF